MRSIFNLKSIKGKLLITSVLLLTIPIIVLGFLSYDKAKSSLDEHGAKRLETSVKMTIEMIDALHKDVEKGTLSLEEAQERVKETVLGVRGPDGTRAINSNIDLGEYGYIFILSQDGVQLAHPDIEEQSVWDVEDSSGVKFGQAMIEIGNNGGGITYYEWEHPADENRVEPKVTYSEADPHWGWIVNGSTYMTDFNEEANSIMYSIIFVIGITLVVGLPAIILITNKIANPIQLVSEQMDEIADGNLTLEPIMIKSKDETGQLANSLNRMQEELRSILGNLSIASNSMASQSEELNQAAIEVSDGAIQMTRTMEELATGSESQANRSSDIATMMQGFAEQIDDVGSNGEQVQKSSNIVLDMTDRGRELMDTSTKQMESIDDIVHDAVIKVEGLDAHSQEISELVSIIHDIAEQTNLLALNAAIEAARAGEHGQGFAVVADEVRKLAEESSNSVTDITNIVNRIQSESSIVSSSLRNGYSEVEEGMKHIRNTSQTFIEINEYVNEMVANINGMTDNLVQIVSNSQNMNEAVEDIAAVSEESAAGVEEMTATTEQTNAAMEEVANSSENLAQLAEELNGLVEEFRL